MGEKILTIHNRILMEKIKNAEREVRVHAPEIEMDQQIRIFLSNVNKMKLKERLAIAWRLIARKM